MHVDVSGVSENMRQSAIGAVRVIAGRAVASLIALCLVSGSGASALEVITTPGTAEWGRLYSSSVTLAWDWAWDWVPADAVSVRVTVAGAKRGKVLERTFAKGADASVTFELGEVTSESEDVYTATLAFLDVAGAGLTDRSADLYALAGSFNRARVCTGPAERLDWRAAKGTVLVPYDAAWSDSACGASSGQLTVVPSEGETVLVPLADKSGHVAVKGKGETALELTFGDDAEAYCAADVLWRLGGLFMVFR